MTARPGAAAGLLLAAVALLAGCSTAGDDPGDGAAADDADGEGDALVVDEPWATTTGETAAVYLTLDNSAGPDRLVDVTTDAADTVSLMASGGADPAAHDDHEPGHDPTIDLEVPTGTVDLAPGGMHVMLDDLVQPLAAGDRVTVDMRFAEAGERRIGVEVVGWDEVVERMSDQPATGS